MKKPLMTVAVLGCAAVVTAQTVTSQNIVGYAKVSLGANQLDLVAVNFDTGSAPLSVLIGDQLPTNAKVYLWDKVANTYIPSTKGFFGWSPDSTVNLGDSMWLQSPSAAEVIFSGEVLIAGTNSVALDGLDATGYYYPVETLFGDTDLAAQLPTNSKLYIWNGASYNPYTKGFFGWGTGANELIGPTTGFWVESAGAISWDEERPFTP